MSRMRFATAAMYVNQDWQLWGGSCCPQGTQRCPDVQLQTVVIIFQYVTFIGLARRPELGTPHQPQGM